MRRHVALWVVVLGWCAASCTPPRLGPAPTAEREPSSAWAAPARRPSPLLATARSRPELRDLVLYLEARDAAHRGDDAAAVARAGQLAERFPDSIWLPVARRGDDARALELVRAARGAKLRGVALHRAERATARLHRHTPSLFEPAASHLAEGELLLAEGDAARAAEEARAALAA